MRHSLKFPHFAGPAAFALAICCAGCSVPLAPGYALLKESREVEFVPGDPPEVRVHAKFTLKNSGTTDLPFIDINLPDEKAFGRSDLHAQLDGREVALALLPEEYQHELPNALRLTFDPPWSKGKTQQLSIEYSFRSPQDSGARIALTADTFHFGSRGWFPQPEPPKHFMSPYPKRPDKMEYTVRVPAGYAVLAGGALKGSKKEGGQNVLRFQLRAADLAPFVVAGRYSSMGDNKKSAAVVFWTRKPLKENPAAAEAAIANVWAALQSDFGPLEKEIRAVHIVESPSLLSHVEGGPGPAAAAFPGGVLVNSPALMLGINSDDFLEMVTHALAHNWFGDELYPRPDSGIGLGEGLPEYATIVVEESRRGAKGRRERILRYLNEYDAAVRNDAEKPLAVTMLTDPPAQRRIGLAKAPLFFAALEDGCGEAPMREGLKRMVALLRGREAGYDDLRSALEEASGKNLGEIFRAWLNGKGIPQDFRDRYDGKPAPADATPHGQHPPDKSGNRPK